MSTCAVGWAFQTNFCHSAFTVPNSGSGQHLPIYILHNILIHFSIETRENKTKNGNTGTKFSNGRIEKATFGQPTESGGINQGKCQSNCGTSTTKAEF